MRKGIFIVPVLLFSLGVGVELRAENFMAAGPLSGYHSVMPSLFQPATTSPDPISNLDQEVVVSNNVKSVQAKTQTFPSEWRFAEPILLDPPVDQLIAVIQQKSQATSAESPDISNLLVLIL